MCHKHFRLFHHFSKLFSNISPETIVSSLGMDIFGVCHAKPLLIIILRHINRSISHAYRIGKKYSVAYTHIYSGLYNVYIFRMLIDIWWKRKLDSIRSVSKIINSFIDGYENSWSMRRGRYECIALCLMTTVLLLLLYRYIYRTFVKRIYSIYICI